MRNNVPPGYKTHALGVIPVQRERGFRECEHRFRKYPKSVHVEPEQVFTLNRNRCSRSTGIGVHVEPESAFTLKRNTQSVRPDRGLTGLKPVRRPLSAVVCQAAPRCGLRWGRAKASSWGRFPGSGEPRCAAQAAGVMVAPVAGLMPCCFSILIQRGALRWTISAS